MSHPCHSTAAVRRGGGDDEDEDDDDEEEEEEEAAAAASANAACEARQVRKATRRQAWARIAAASYLRHTRTRATRNAHTTTAAEVNTQPRLHTDTKTDAGGLSHASTLKLTQLK